jgi:hypothetical protein
MTQELMYTSAPRGLKPGSRGFCTVVSTQGMAANLAERLEALSGYRHLYGGENGRTTIDQVVAQHVQISVGGRRVHVLSRVHDAGVDYSQRSNKFAHHVVLDLRELPVAGPAWLLSQPGFLESTWDGEPRVLPVGRPIPAGDASTSVCQVWAAASGDSGWGGVLAATAVGEGRKTATLIVRPGFDPLPLVAESLALLPEHLRWSVSFCTYFTKLPPGVECSWRVVIDGTPEAAAAARGSQGLVINLCQPLPKAEGGPFVESARTGIPVSMPAPPSPAVPIVPPPPSIEELERILNGDSPNRAKPAAKKQNVLVIDELYDIPPSPPPLAPLGPAESTLGQKKRSFKRKSRAGWWIAGGVAAVTIISGAIAAVWFSTDGDLASLFPKVQSGQVQQGDNAPPRSNHVAKEGKTPKPSVSVEDTIVSLFCAGKLDEAAEKLQALSKEADSPSKKVAANLATKAKEKLAELRTKQDFAEAETFATTIIGDSRLKEVASNSDLRAELKSLSEELLTRELNSEKLIDKLSVLEPRFKEIAGLQAASDADQPPVIAEFTTTTAKKVAEVLRQQAISLDDKVSHLRTINSTAPLLSGHSELTSLRSEVAKEVLADAVNQFSESLKKSDWKQAKLCVDGFSDRLPPGSDNEVQGFKTKITGSLANLISTSVSAENGSDVMSAMSAINEYFPDLAAEGALKDTLAKAGEELEKLSFDVKVESFPLSLKPQKGSGDSTNAVSFGDTPPSKLLLLDTWMDKSPNGKPLPLGFVIDKSDRHHAWTVYQKVFTDNGKETKPTKVGTFSFSQSKLTFEIAKLDTIARPTDLEKLRNCILEAWTTEGPRRFQLREIEVADPIKMDKFFGASDTSSSKTLEIEDLPNGFAPPIVETHLDKASPSILREQQKLDGSNTQNRTQLVVFGDDKTEIVFELKFVFNSKDREFTVRPELTFADWQPKLKRSKDYDVWTKTPGPFSKTPRKPAYGNMQKLLDDIGSRYVAAKTKEGAAKSAWDAELKKPQKARDVSKKTALDTARDTEKQYSDDQEIVSRTMNWMRELNPSLPQPKLNSEPPPKPEPGRQAAATNQRDGGRQNDSTEPPKLHYRVVFDLGRGAQLTLISTGEAKPKAKGPTSAVAEQ